MMLLLPFMAVALAIPPKRSTSALGVFLSIVMVVTYHKINEYAAGVGGMGVIDPIIALWVPFLLFAGLILWMYHVIAHVPGGQPIGALEIFAAKAGKSVRKLFRFLSLAQHHQIYGAAFRHPQPRRACDAGTHFADARSFG